MAPQDESLAAGDTVMVCDMPEDTGLNGITGVLVKPVGKGRWSLKIEGDEKSKVVPTVNLQKITLKSKGPADGAPAKYSIVGTWDDWEPQEMTFNSELTCFEFTAAIGSDGSESFKILQNGDWDGCVYPDRKDASPYDDHKLNGPDDGGLNEEWTIGLHPEDKAPPGVRVKIFLHVLKDGSPMRVTWKADKQESEQARRPAVDTRMPVDTRRPRAPVEETYYAPPEEEYRPRKNFSDEADRVSNYWEDSTHGGQTRQSARPKSWGEWAARQEEDVEEVERKARERLMARLAAADEAKPLAIEDEDGTTWKEYNEDNTRIDRQQQVEANRRRYRRSIAEATGENLNEEGRVPACCFKNGVSLLPSMKAGQITAAMFGEKACDACYGKWLEIEKKGEKSDVISQSLPVGMRIYLRMKNSKMNAEKGAENEDKDEDGDEVSNSKLKSKRNERKKALAESNAAREDDDPYWDELPLPK